MFKRSRKEEKTAERTRVAMVHGFTLFELVIAISIMLILSVIAVGAFSSTQNKAHVTVSNNDMNAYATAIQQAFIDYPTMSRFTDSSPANATKYIVDAINSELDDSLKLTYLTGATGSGGVAYSTTKRDGWGMPYGLYVYTNSNITTIADASGTALSPTGNSCLYIAVMSAGTNGIGGPAGVDGTNITAGTGAVTSAAAMVNNTDGKDDMGVIVRVLNGDVRSASFGSKSLALGDLTDHQWILGKPSATGGVCYDFASKKSATVTLAGSLDKYTSGDIVNKEAANVIGTWTLS